MPVRPNPGDPSRFLPLPPAALHILLSLAREPRHGYGIMQDVARQSGGQYKLGPGTLYDNLQRLLDQDLAEQSRKKSDDPRRRYYQLTALGRAVLEADVERLKSVVRHARSSLKPAGARP